MPLALYVEIVNLGVEGIANCGGGSGKVDDHAVRINVADRETLGLEPVGDGIDIRLCRTVFPALLGGRHPAAEVGRRFVGESLDVVRKGFLHFGSAL